MKWPWTKHADAANDTDWTWPESGISAETQLVGPSGFYDGSNFIDGVGGAVDEIYDLDYWTLRARSAALFYGNLYARGIIRRMVTDIINSGLSPESTPDSTILGIPDDILGDWTDTVEKLWRLYGESKEIVDYKGLREEGEIQGQIYTEALICGDCLEVNRIDPKTDLPQIQIVNGDRVQTPPEKQMDPRIVDGVHLDKTGKHLGYWVYQGTNDVPDDRYVYIPARGKKSGRHTAWMVYGPDKREDGIRGEPLLGIAIQPLKDISDFRGSAQLREKLNAMIAMFIKRTGPVKSKILGRAQMRAQSVTGDSTGATKPVGMNFIAPGIISEGLEPGEEPVFHAPNGSGSSFGDFEAAIMVGVAWGLQIPPEILLMSFNKNYSASQAAKNKWNTYISKERPRFASQHCKNHFEDWLISSVLSGKIVATGFLEALSDPRQYDVRRSWLTTEWHGQIEPTVDIVKHVKGAEMAVSNGWSTNAREARGLNGSKFASNIKRQIKENQLKADAMRPMLELQKEYGPTAVDALLNNNPELSAAYILAMAQDDNEVES